MVLLRRAADAAGYAAVGVVEDGAAYKPAPGAGVASKLMLASLVCLVGMAFAIY